MTPGLNSSGKADRRLLVYLLILVVFGLATLMSASAPAGFAKFHDSYYFIKRQILFGLIPGLVLFFLIIKIDYHWFNRASWIIYIFSLLLLVLVFVPGVGVEINNSRSWLNVFGYSFQPSELLKFSIILILAHLVTERKIDWQDWQRSLLPILAVLVPALALLRDVGTMSIIVAIVFAILFLARVPARYLIFLILVGAVGFMALIAVAPYRAERLTVFLHPELDPQGIGYQVNQSFLAVGSGGWWGLGFGQSRQKFQYLPEVEADSIFAVIAEEGGFIVSITLVVLILLFIWRGLQISRNAPDDFGRLIVGGVMTWLAVQSFLNIGAAVGALPLTGVPLPFVSHGGSALLMILAAMGLVASVSRQTNINK